MSKRVERQNQKFNSRQLKRQLKSFKQFRKSMKKMKKMKKLLVKSN